MYISNYDNLICYFSIYKNVINRPEEKKYSVIKGNLTLHLRKLLIKLKNDLFRVLTRTNILL